MIERKLLHASRVAVRRGDMDALGHVNNTVYFRYLEQVRVEWLESLGYAVDPSGEAAPVIVNTACTFLVPLTCPAPIDIRLYAGAVGRSSAETFCDVVRAGEGAPCCQGAAKIVWTNRQTGRSIPLPDQLRRLGTP